MKIDYIRQGDEIDNIDGKIVIDYYNGSAVFCTQFIYNPNGGVM